GARLGEPASNAWFGLLQSRVHCHLFIESSSYKGKFGRFPRSFHFTSFLYLHLSLVIAGEFPNGGVRKRRSGSSRAIRGCPRRVRKTCWADSDLSHSRSFET